MLEYIATAGQRNKLLKCSEVVMLYLVSITKESKTFFNSLLSSYTIRLAENAQILTVVIQDQSHLKKSRYLRLSEVLPVYFLIVISMLGQRRRLYFNIKTALGE